MFKTLLAAIAAALTLGLIAAPAASAFTLPKPGGHPRATIHTVCVTLPPPRAFPNEPPLVWCFHYVTTAPVATPIPITNR